MFHRLRFSSTKTSAINAEFIYRGSFIEPTDRITLPTTSQEEAKATAVERHVETIRNQATDTALQQGRELWSNMLDWILKTSEAAQRTGTEPLWNPGPCAFMVETAGADGKGRSRGM